MDRPGKSKSKSKKRKDINNTISAGKSKTRKISQIKPVKDQSHSEWKAEGRGKGKYMVSPKTIEYSKVIEKYADFLSSTTRREEQNSSNSQYPHYSDQTKKIQPPQSENTGRFNTREGGNYSSFNSDEDELRMKAQDNSASLRANKFHSIGVSEYENKPQSKPKQFQNKTEVSEEKNQKQKEIIEHYNEYKKIKRSDNHKLNEELSIFSKKLNGKERSKADKNINLELGAIMKYPDETSAQQLEQLMGKMKEIERENEALRGRSKDSTPKSREKINLFVMLTKKYSKKFKNILFLLSKLSTMNLQVMNETKDKLICELNQSVDQFDKTVHNPTLLSTLLDTNSNFLKIDSTTPKILDDVEYNSASQDNVNFEPQSSLLTTIEKLQSQIKKLEGENEKIKKKEAEETYEKKYLNEENAKLKKKLSEEKKHHQEAENLVDNIKQMNKDMKSKMLLIGEENKTLKKNLKSLNDRMVALELVKNTQKILENDLKYKDSIICYLESLLRNTKVSPKLYDESKYQANYEKNNLQYSGVDKPYDGERECEQYDYDLSITGEKNLHHSSETIEEDLGKQISYNQEKTPDKAIRNYDEESQSSSCAKNECRIRQSNLAIPKEDLVQTNKSSALKVEIDTLDGEIKQLQNKLKVMIDLNKK